MKHNISRLRILVVEDQDRVRQLIKDVLKGMGIAQVYEYSNAEKALQFLSNPHGHIDVILCDLVLDRGMSGLDFLAKVKKADIDAHFLMISGKSDANAIKTAQKLGVDGYILKPFSADQVEVKLRVLVSQSSAA